jgi:hypothetical protein
MPVVGWKIPKRNLILAVEFFVRGELADETGKKKSDSNAFFRLISALMATRWVTVVRQDFRFRLS